MDEPSEAWHCAKAWFADKPIVEAYIELELYHQQLAPEEPVTEWAEAPMPASFDSEPQSLQKRWASESLVALFLCLPLERCFDLQLNQLKLLDIDQAFHRHFQRRDHGQGEEAHLHEGLGHGDTNIFRCHFQGNDVTGNRF